MRGHRNGKEPAKVEIATKFGNNDWLLSDSTPQHRDNFLKLVDEQFYDSLIFHRVIREFMVQGGDPQSKGADANARLGSGGPGYTVEAEIRPDLLHVKGALSAARQGDNVNPERRSSGSQFYLVQGRQFSDNELRRHRRPHRLLRQRIREWLGQCEKWPV